MKILILGDMEGVSGIVHWDQVDHKSPMYQEGRRLYTEELNAAARGAFSAGAETVLMVDSHGAGAAGTMGGPAFNSIIPDLVHEEAEFITHHGWGNIIETLKEGWDAVFYVGIHVRTGHPKGVLSHTIATTHWFNIFINHQIVGEIGVMAALCAHFKVPMVLVTGDNHTCEEAAEFLGDTVHTVAVKKGLSRFAARNISPVKARRLIEEGAQHALSTLKDRKPLSISSPVEIKMEIVTAENMDKYRRIAGVELIEPRTVISRGSDFLEAWERVAPFEG